VEVEAAVHGGAATATEFAELEIKESAAQFDARLEHHLSVQQSNGQHGYEEGLGYHAVTAAVQTTIQEVVPTVERKRGKVRERSQRTKELFEARISACAGLKEGSQDWWAVRQSYTKQTSKSCRSDWRQHVMSLMGLISDMTMATDKGDAKQVSRLVSKIAGSGRGSIQCSQWWVLMESSLVM
jgi:hypothetical protein